jgi:Glycine transporter
MGARRICSPHQAHHLRRAEESSDDGVMEHKPTRHARLLQTIDIAGTFVLAIQGASIAAVKGLDAFGIVVVSLATATGGGIMRDLLIGESPPEALRGWPIVTSAFLAHSRHFSRSTWSRRFRGRPDRRGRPRFGAARSIWNRKGPGIPADADRRCNDGRDQRRWRIYDPGYPSRRSFSRSAGRLSRDGGDYRRDRPGRRSKRQGARQHRSSLRRRNMLRPENCRGLAALASANSEPALRQQSSRPFSPVRLRVRPLIGAADPTAIAARTHAPVAS